MTIRSPEPEQNGAKMAFHHVIRNRSGANSVMEQTFPGDIKHDTKIRKLPVLPEWSTNGGQESACAEKITRRVHSGVPRCRSSTKPPASLGRFGSCRSHQDRERRALSWNDGEDPLALAERTRPTPTGTDPWSADQPEIRRAAGPASNPSNRPSRRSRPAS